MNSPTEVNPLPPLPYNSTSEVSPHIDAAICDLIAHLSRFSDDHFDTLWMQIQDDELEALVVKLLHYWTQSLDGRIIAGLLLEIRNDTQSSD